jgi:hypothetical protein
MHANVNIKKLTFNKLLQTFMTLTYNQHKKHMINIKVFTITLLQHDDGRSARHPLPSFHASSQTISIDV